MFKRVIGAAVLFGMAAAAPPAIAAGCADRDLVVERLQSKYSEAMVAGGLQGVQDNKMTMLEVWSSEKTGTFTVIMTNAQGVSCILAAGTDWFQQEA
mmetsp:Transcript_18294/g.29182  ORF Transcript_18294/g.29182 Transcript_18294/m.29182 type:complete len:97 (-) Transcript_18294:12-302(-)